MSFINMFYRSETSSKNKELQTAINERKSDEVKILLSTGADINHTVNQNLDTMLHTATSAGVVYDLLGYSARVDAKNLYDKTPLHSAAECGKSPDFVRALLAHGCTVDAKDSEGNTPLNLAVKRPVKNFEAIKELVLAGAVVNETKWEHNRDYCTPMDTAVLNNDLECAKALIKYHLLRLRSPDVSSIDLSSYYRSSGYPVMLSFLNRCCEELRRMKRCVVSEESKTTLHQVVMQKFVCRDAMGKDEEAVEKFTDKCLDVVKDNKFPIYHDFVIAKLRTRLDKKGMVSRLKSVEIYTEINKKVALNFDSSKYLSRFLSRNDLFNFIIAYDAPPGVGQAQTSSLLSEVRKMICKRLSEASTSTSFSKLIKLE